jgi:hypothetical protein
MLFEKTNLLLYDGLIASSFGSTNSTIYIVDTQSYNVNEITFKNKFFAMSFYLGNTEFQSVREVKSLANALSSVGGLLGLISFLNLIFSSFFVRFFLEIELIEELFIDSASNKHSLDIKSERSTLLWLLSLVNS